jgi:energy-coupling factor transporter ATP-binding protein EcfA2
MTASHARLLSSDWPFPGLRPFTFADAEYLFGRNEQKYALYRMLDRGRFVSVIGSSGSGKSSLVFAALLPVLHAENEEDRNKRKGERAWVWTDLRPGRAPLRNLADALARLSGDSDGEVTQARREWIAYYLRRSSLGIVDVLTETDSIGSGRLVIIVDQFEELFRFAGSHEGNGGAPEQQAQSRNEAESFVQLLIEASRSRDCKVNILITMRSDFIGDCARFQGLPELVSAVQFLVPALSRSQREEVICKPLAKSGSSIEPALVKSLLNDSDSDFDQLPVLQHCLLRLWEKAGPVQAAVPANGPSAEAIAPTGASPRQLTLKHYDAIGWMSGALSRHANEIMGDLPGLEWTIEKTFRALAEIDRDGRAIRRSRLFKQLKDETGVADDALR